MSARPFDYDATTIPASYDRARDHGPEVLELWMRAVRAAAVGRGPVATVLDLGCGTGRFSRGLANAFDAHVVGVDPSIRMLEQASAKARGSSVRCVNGRGEALPLPDGAVDVVFMSMVYHHFGQPARVAAECRRVLRPGGIVFLRAGSADRVPDYPYVPFVPESLPLLHQVLPTVAAMRDTFEAAGFRTVRHELTVQEIADTHAAYVEKLEAGADSVLARLDPGIVAAGIARLRAHASTIDPRPVTEPIDTIVFA